MSADKDSTQPLTGTMQELSETTRPTADNPIQFDGNKPTNEQDLFGSIITAHAVNALIDRLNINTDNDKS